MIQVYTNKENYQYDLHSLIKAFYPERDVKVHGLEQISRSGELRYRRQRYKRTERESLKQQGYGTGQ